MNLSPNQREGIRPLAQKIGVELAALIAVIEVESNGVTSTVIDGAEMPVIRWEGHYFHRLLKGEERDRAVKLGLASPKAGGVKNPASQKGRYDILSRASVINPAAAYSSISIGVGQVMGAHAESLGFASPQDMFKRAAEGFEGQVDLMVRFIEKNGLVDELRRKDWSAFARAYNGPAYAKNAYHTEMAAAYRRALNSTPGGYKDGLDAGSAAGMLRLGSSGADVREVQRLLVRAGYPLKVDGDFGPSTKEAVRAFQRDQNIEVDGVVGPKTQGALLELKADPAEDLSSQPITDMPETTPAVVGAGGGIGVAVAADKLTEIADKLAGTGSLEMISTGLYTLAGALIVGSLIYGAWGYLKAQRTYEGVA